MIQLNTTSEVPVGHLSCNPELSSEKEFALKNIAKSYMKVCFLRRHLQKRAAERKILMKYY